MGWKLDRDVLPSEALRGESISGQAQLLQLLELLAPSSPLSPP